MALSEHVDVLIVGAGLSGIGAAHHLQAPPEEAGFGPPGWQTTGAAESGPEPMT